VNCAPGQRRPCTFQGRERDGPGGGRRARLRGGIQRQSAPQPRKKYTSNLNRDTVAIGRAGSKFRGDPPPPPFCPKKSADKSPKSLKKIPENRSKKIVKVSKAIFSFSCFKSGQNRPFYTPFLKFFFLPAQKKGTPQPFCREIGDPPSLCQG
jgi:hypothetical protein